jgi:hypothetical protein
MPLSFFRPFYLWALLLAAGPLIIHLFNRKRTVRLDFSTIRFFDRTAIRANRARTLRRLLQLLARMGLVAAAALIFARPYDARHPFAVLTSPHAVTYAWVDRTVSMDYRQGGSSRLTSAVQLIDTLGSRLSSAANAFVYSEDLREFVPRKEARPGGRGPRHGPNGLSDMLHAFRNRTAEQGELPLLFLFSDFQENTAAAVDSFLLSDSLWYPVVCVSVAPHAPWNSGIADAGIAAENPGMLQTVVYAHGRRLREKGIHAAVGGMRVGHAVVSVDAGDSARVVMDIPRELGEAAGTVVLQAGDPFAADDTCSFVKGAGDPRSVLIAGHQRESYVIAAALGASAGSFWGEVISKAPEEVRLEDVDTAGLVVLNGIVHPPQAVRSLLMSRALGRKAVLFSPSLHPQGLMFCREVLQHAGAKGEVALDSSRVGLSIVLPDTISAMWRGFPRIRDRDVAVYAYLRGLPGEVLLRLDNGEPLLTAVADSGGHVWVLAATPLGISEANNLCESGFFVPLVDRLARYAVGSVAPESVVWTAGWPQRNPYFGKRGGASVHAADNSPIAQWGNQPMVALESPGTYRVQPAGDVAHWISVGVDPAECSLDYRAPVVPDDKRRFVASVNAGDFGAFLDSAGNSMPLYTLWALLAVFALADMLLGGLGPRALRRAAESAYAKRRR